MQWTMEAAIHLHRFSIGSTSWIPLLRTDRRQVTKRIQDRSLYIPNMGNFKQTKWSNEYNFQKWSQWINIMINIQ